MKTKFFNGKTYKNHSVIDIVDYLTLNITDTKYEAISLCNDIVLAHQLFETETSINLQIPFHRNEGITIHYF